jgi:hypothetical protein
MYSKIKVIISIISDGNSWDSLVDTVTDYGLDGQGSIPGKGKRFLSTPKHLDAFLAVGA